MAAALGPAATGQADAPDRTATGKAHFEVLDGLRGTAALIVVLFHIQGITVKWDGARVVLHHAPLAVDFFFALSGFVIGYAYDDRWGRMRTGRFLALRLIRLHPLVILGALLGLASYLLDPFAGQAQAVPLRAVLGAFALCLFALPSWSLPNRWTDTHPLNGPIWTLFQEYVGNLAYALVLRRLRARWLAVLAVPCGAALAIGAAMQGTLDQGSYWETFWMAPVRLFFPFLTGLWLYRVRDRLPDVRIGWLPLSLAMLGAMAFPTLPAVGGVKLNGLYEAACVILLFPAIIVAGRHSEAGRGMLWLCKASGRLSYPIYITHFPFLYVWMNFVANGSASPAALVAIGTALVPFLLLVAWAAHAWWDLPIRARLRGWLGRDQISGST
ncbi:MULTISPECIES: acyltransferase [unclassified Sphingomonas]|jgi:peptidoglycan/LPS O-acetylase OafA/YrhL|nr:MULTISPECIES: acyltransferase [unclassified Sphingomonas]